jgi:hypothetical protein
MYAFINPSKAQLLLHSTLDYNTYSGVEIIDVIPRKTKNRFMKSDRTMQSIHYKSD